VFLKRGQSIAPQRKRSSFVLLSTIFDHLAITDLPEMGELRNTKSLPVCLRRWLMRKKNVDKKRIGIDRHCCELIHHRKLVGACSDETLAISET
jgi:hypothetical protein